MNNLKDFGLEIEWPIDYFDRREIETPDKGYLDVFVRLTNGEHYHLSFYDLDRVAQCLKDENARGAVSFTEINLILLKEVNTETVTQAVIEQYKTGFFKLIKPDYSSVKL